MSGLTGGLAAWRFASRLARREVRRRPGRTALVVVLVALPVLAMAVASVGARTARTDSTLRRWRAGTDIVVVQPTPHAIDLTSDVPAGTTVRSMLIADYTPILTANGESVDDVTIAGGVDELADGHVYAVSGGPAPARGEAWLSASLADQLELDVGDELSLAHPRGTWTVSGVGRLDADFDQSAVVLDRFPLEQFRRDAGRLQAVSTVDLPGSPSPDEVHTVGSAPEEDIGVDGNVRWPGAISAYLDPAFQREQLA
jgi:putative ABC transport system permease protein